MHGATQHQTVPYTVALYNMTKSVQFVQLTQDGKLALHEDGRALLTSLQQPPVGIVSVCGRSRGGKSTLLNLLATSTDAFKVGGSADAVTRGIWAAVHEMNGSTYLLIDTEGLDDTSSTGQADAMIFCLTVLISTTILFNQDSNLNSPVLDTLSSVASAAAHVYRRSTHQSLTSLAQSSSIFPGAPSLIVVVRDWALTAEDPDIWLETALSRPHNDNNLFAFAQARDEQNQRDTIKEVFVERTAVLLPRPFNTEDATRTTTPLITSAEFRPEFTQAYNALRDMVFPIAQGRPGRRVPGSTKPLNGPALISLLDIYIKQLNSGAIITSHACLELLREVDAKQALQDACKRLELQLQTGSQSPNTLVSLEFDKLSNALVSLGITFSEPLYNEIQIAWIEKSSMLQERASREVTIAELCKQLDALKADQNSSMESNQRLLEALKTSHMQQLKQTESKMQLELQASRTATMNQISQSTKLMQDIASKTKELQDVKNDPNRYATSDTARRLLLEASIFASSEEGRQFFNRLYGNDKEVMMFAKQAISVSHDFQTAASTWRRRLKEWREGNWFCTVSASNPDYNGQCDANGYHYTGEFGPVTVTAYFVKKEEPMEYSISDLRDAADAPYQEVKAGGSRLDEYKYKIIAHARLALSTATSMYDAANKLRISFRTDESLTVYVSLHHVPYALMYIHRGIDLHFKLGRFKFMVCDTGY